MTRRFDAIDSSWDEELRNTKAALEALLFVSDVPVTLEQLSDVCEMPLDITKEALEMLQREYSSLDRGFTLERIAGGYQILTRPEYAPAIKRLKKQERPLSALSRAALEVLAMVAYRQPITRAEIDSLRGVSSDSATKTLLDRGLIEEVGRKPVIGRPSLFGTTQEFLRKFGLSSLKDLPDLKSLRDENHGGPKGE